MNRLVERIIIFAAGAVISGLTTFFVTKKVVEKKCDKELEREMNEYRRLKDTKVAESKGSEEKDADKIMPPETYSSPKEQNRQQEREIFRRSQRPRVDYSAPSTRVSSDEEHNHSVGEALTREMHQESRKEPEIIAPVDYMTKPGYTGTALLYYAGDRTLTINEDQDEEVIKDFDEYRKMVGNVIEAAGFNDVDYNGPTTIYIRNFSRQTDYEVTRLSGRYKE